MIKENKNKCFPVFKNKNRKRKKNWIDGLTDWNTIEITSVSPRGQTMKYFISNKLSRWKDFGVPE